MRSDTSTLRLIDRKASKAPKCFLDTERDAVGWMLDVLTPADRDLFVRTRPRPGQHAATVHKSLDCTIMDVADDIAYGVHDLEDALAFGLVGAEDIRRYGGREAASHFSRLLAAK